MTLIIESEIELTIELKFELNLQLGLESYGSKVRVLGLDIVLRRLGMGTQRRGQEPLSNYSEEGVGNQEHPSRQRLYCHQGLEIEQGSGE